MSNEYGTKSLIQHLKDEIERQAKKQGALFDGEVIDYSQSDEPEFRSEWVRFHGVLDLVALSGVATEFTKNDERP